MNSTKKALVRSVISLFVMFTMLVGSTFAWFTDKVTSSNNVITTGTLDVALEYKSDWNGEWETVDNTTKIFKEGVLYEPGYTEVVFLRVSNVGSLALKYLLTFNIVDEKGSINVYGEDFKVSEYLEAGVYVKDENDPDLDIAEKFADRKSALKNADFKSLKDVYAKPVICDNKPILPGEDTAQIVAIVLTMPESVGNEANTMHGADAPWIELGVNLIATQYTYEQDSFNDQYDAGATLDNKLHIIDGLDTLENAFKYGGTGTIVNMHITDVNVELDNDKSLALNMNSSKLERGDATDYAIVNRGDLSITGEGTIRSEMKGSIENWGILYINNLNIEVLGTKYGFHVKDGEVEINNLDLTAQRGGINVQGGKVTINSGSITTTTPNSSFGVGYLVYAGGDSEVIINGGDFRYEGAYYRHGVLYAGNDASIVVYGGTFGEGGSNVAKKPWLQTGQNGTITIYGGTFEFDPSAFVAEGYEAVKGTDGWWTVSPKQ